MATTEDIAADQEQHGKGQWEFRFAYDDTGEEIKVSAPNGWSIHPRPREAPRLTRLIEQGRGEGQSPDWLTTEQFELRPVREAPRTG